MRERHQLLDELFVADFRGPKRAVWGRWWERIEGPREAVEEGFVTEPFAVESGVCEDVVETEFESWTGRAIPHQHHRFS